MITSQALLAASMFLLVSFSSSSLAMLVIGRLMQGAASAVIWAVAVVCLADALPPIKLAGSIPRVIGIQTFGTILGPLFGGGLFAAASWAAPFFVLFALAIGTFLTWILLDLEGAEEQLSWTSLSEGALKEQKAEAEGMGTEAETKPLIPSADEPSAAPETKTDSAIEIDASDAPTLGSDDSTINNFGPVPPKSLAKALSAGTQTPGFFPRFKPNDDIMSALSPPRDPEAASIGTMLSDGNILTFIVVSFASSMLISGLESQLPHRLAKDFSASATSIGSIFLFLSASNLVFGFIFALIFNEYLYPTPKRLVGMLGLMCAGLCAAFIGAVQPSAGSGWMIPPAIGMGACLSVFQVPGVEDVVERVVGGEGLVWFCGFDLGQGCSMNANCFLASFAQTIRGTPYASSDPLPDRSSSPRSFTPNPFNTRKQSPSVLFAVLLYVALPRSLSSRGCAGRRSPRQRSQRMVVKAELVALMRSRRRGNRCFRRTIDRSRARSL